MRFAFSMSAEVVDAYSMLYISVLFVSVLKHAGTVYSIADNWAPSLNKNLCVNNS